MRLALLQPPVDQRFFSMTFPAFRHLLELAPAPKLLAEAGCPLVQPVAVGAWEASTAIGLMLLALPLVSELEAELLSIYVVPESRGKGLGVALLEAAEKVAANAGFPSLCATWTQGAPGTGWWEKQLPLRGWRPPQRRTLSLLFTAEEALRFPWLDRFPVRDNCEIIPFSQVTAEEMAALKRSQEASRWIAEDLVPWQYIAGGFEEQTSVALRSPEGIMGWVINHKVTDDWLRFTCSYIRKDWGRRARILPLFSASLHRMVDAGFTKATFVAPVRHPTMVRFVEEHMAPWVSKARWTWESRKSFTKAKTARGSAADGEELCQKTR